EFSVQKQTRDGQAGGVGLREQPFENYREVVALDHRRGADGVRTTRLNDHQGGEREEGSRTLLALAAIDSACGLLAVEGPQLEIDGRGQTSLSECSRQLLVQHPSGG